MRREPRARFGFVFLLAVLAVPASPRTGTAQSQTAPESYAQPATRTPSGRTEAGAMDDGYAAPGIPPPVAQDDIAEDPQEQDGLDPVPREGQRAVVQDGDPNPPETPQSRDGIVDVGEPAAPEDGTDPSVVDTRSPEDIAVFENPAAGYDPLLFQIEDIDIADNRTVQRLASLEPYDPVGIKVGSFVLFPELDFGTSYYSNVFRSTDARSDWAFDALPSMRLVSNWSTHALEVRANGDLSYFDTYDSEDDRGYLVEARGRLDVTRRTNIEGLLSRQLAQESRSSINASSAGPRVDQTTERAEVALNHRFNRLSMRLRGSVADYAFADTLIAGVPQINSDRDYRQTEGVVRAAWEFKPTLSAFTEVAVNSRDYDALNQSDLISRSSKGERYRAGLSFGNTGKILRGEVALGYGVQRPDDHRLSEIDGLIIDANATWRITELTSLLFTASSDVTETTTANVGGALYRSVGVEARHAVRRYLIASAGLSYNNQNSFDGLIDQSEWRTSLGLEYFLNRETVFFGNYAHTNHLADDGTAEYGVDEVHLGVKLRR